jgi:peptide/nickel transport system substrate-binding protein
MLLFGACAAPAPEEPMAEEGMAMAPEESMGVGTLTIGIRNADYDTLDPHVSSFSQAAYVFRNIFDRLVYLDENANNVGGLATSWEASDDATEWIITLRDDVTFHDGSALTAGVVKFNFDRMKDPATESKQSGPLMGPYLGSEVIDDSTLKVTFETPYALFPFALSSPFMGIVSQQAVEEHGANFNDALIGSGPYKFVSEIPGNEVVLERNDDYNWGPSIFHEGPAHLESVVFRFILEEEARLSALETGEALIIDEVPPGAVERVQASEATSVMGAPKVGLARGIHFNTTYAPTDDIRMRQAIMHAIDREEIDQIVFKGVYPVAYQLLTRGVKFYDESAENMFPYDPERSVELLEEMGYTEMNDDGYRMKDGESFFIYHATFPGYVAELPAEVIQAQLKRVGIDFRVNVMSGTAMMDGMASLESTFHTALIGTYSPDPGLFLDRMYNSSSLGTRNWSHWSSEELDGLLQRGLETGDEAERAEIYKEVQRIINENALGAGIYANVSVFGVSAKVEGFKFDPFAQPEISDVSINE